MATFKLHKPPKKYVIAFIVFMPIATCALCYIMFGKALFQNWRYPVVGLSIIYPIGFVSWYIQVQYELFIRQKFKELEQVWQRVFAKIAGNLFLMTPSTFLLLYAFDYFNILGYTIKPGDFKKTYFVGLILNLALDALWETIFSVDKYKEKLSEKELLEQLQLQQEFDQIKNKLNPHFLFNCFNVLSTLIAEDKKHAETFIMDMSKMYRYLLKSNHEDFVPLENEIAFLNSYYNLLKTRHGDALNMTLDVDKKYFSNLVPSLSLQLLVENAVKHNIAHRSQPLQLSVSVIEGNMLEIKNNLQLKEQQEKSTGIGLNSIRSKYALIRHDDLDIIRSEKEFTVRLPLIRQDYFTTR